MQCNGGARDAVNIHPILRPWISFLVEKENVLYVSRRWTICIVLPGRLYVSSTPYSYVRPSFSFPRGGAKNPQKILPSLFFFLSPTLFFAKYISEWKTHLRVRMPLFINVTPQSTSTSGTNNWKKDHWGFSSILHSLPRTSMFVSGVYWNRRVLIHSVFCVQFIATFKFP